jgi:hypothetical protein
MSARHAHVLTPKSRRLHCAKASDTKVLWNKIRLAKKPHLLKCGCVIQPGELYHSAGMKIKGHVVYSKQHALGLCTETMKAH